MSSARFEALFSKPLKPGLLINSQSDLFYLTGVSLEGYFLFAVGKEVYAFTNGMMADHVKSIVPCAQVLSGHDPMKVFISFLKKKRISVIALELKAIRYATFKLLKENHIGMMDSKNLIADIRQIKDAKEIENIRESCKIANDTYVQAKRFLKPGVSETQISFKIEEIFARNFVKQSFPTIVAFGKNSAFPHHVSGETKLAKNDVVLIDMGCVYKGYCSDLTRTCFLGRISEQNRLVYSLVAKARKEAVNKLKPGSLTKDIDKAARTAISKAGYGEYFIHSTGHGVGIDIHEEPRLNIKNKAVIKPGMVVTIEPGIYLPGKFGVRIEDTLLVTNKGNEVLTR